MGTNNTKTNKEAELSYQNTVFKQIEKILDGKITVGELISMNQKNGFKLTIDNILNKYSDTKKLVIFIISEVDNNLFKTHKEFHGDIDVVKLAIQKDSNSFYLISSAELKKHKDVGKEVIKAFIRENKNFYEVEFFLETNFKKDKKKLFETYFEYLSSVNDYYINDLSKNLFFLKDTNKILYDLLHTNKLFTPKGKNIIINENFIKKFVNEVLKDELYEKINLKEKKEYIIKKLYTYFLIANNNLSSDEKVIFDLALNLINISLSKKIKETKKKEEEKPEFEISSTEKKKEVPDLHKDDDFNDFIDFSYPECNSYKVSGGYNIETITGKNIFISENEKENFTTKALKNYIKFYNTLYNLGLNFLWDKYSYDFKILCNNKFSFDYMHSEGITESKTLSVLNMIGKNIGVPEHQLVDEEGNESAQIKCFKTLGDAKNTFSEIKETGMINNIKYSDSTSFGNGAVENKLIEVLCIDQKGNGLNISQWK